LIHQPIPRRTFLRGVGTAMALPLLEAMLPLSALAQSAKKARPNRMAFLFVPNGAHMPAWTPAAEGPGFELPSILEPLKNVRDSVMVLSGLTQNGARPLGDGPGDHARSAAAWLTGCHPRKTSGADIKVGISVDQLAAQKIGHWTPFPSLELGCERGAQAGDCDSGYSCAYSSCIPRRTEATPVAKEVNPRLVFERLFATGDPQETAESRHRRERYKKSILDFVLDDAAQLRKQLGTHDQRKLDEYFSGVREIEQRLARAETLDAQARQVIGSRPTGAPADFGEHLRLMCDMLVLAFQADLTRVCTFMLANEGSNRSYRLIGVGEGHHDLSHHGQNPEKQEKIRQINRFHVTQLAYLLEKMQSIREGEGTLLDNSMVVYGGGISDGDRHNHDELPILLAGKGAGTIKTGRHVRYAKDTPMSNLFLSLLDRIGVPAETIGDSTGRLQQLF
jgi:Protein of unknown function (DUF1552)